MMMWVRAKYTLTTSHDEGEGEIHKRTTYDDEGEGETHTTAHDEMHILTMRVKAKYTKTQTVHIEGAIRKR